MQIFKTLEREYTRSLYEGTYGDLTAKWSQLFQEDRKRLTGAYHLFYQAIRGRDISKSFSTGIRRTINRHAAKSILDNLIDQSPNIQKDFEGIISPTAVYQIIQMLQPAPDGYYAIRTKDIVDA